jgi:DSF synthase
VTATFGQYQTTTEVGAAAPVRWPSPPYNRSVAEFVPALAERALRAPGVPVPETVADPQFPPGPYRELETSLDRRNKTFWCFMRPDGVPSFTRTLLRELIAVRGSIQRLFALPDAGDDAPIRYFVGGSRLPRIYNLGGDLGFFAACIRAGDRAALRAYAYDCIDVGYHMWRGFKVPVITIALVQGDALGGGFEGALSFNVLVAERSAKFGLPEILFNLFPGMGAFSFLSRKLDAARAQRMIMSGQIYGAEELHALGLIDVLAEDGKGEDAVRDYIARHSRQHAVHRNIYRARERVNPLSFEEMREITEIWVDAAMQLDTADLRKMERLMALQVRRLAGGAGNGGV